MAAPNKLAPNSRAHRASAKPSVIKMLPAAGCDEPAPPLPPGRRWSTAEKQRWEELWASPQATEWGTESSGSVARLVTFESALFANGNKGSAWQATEARQISAELGLTPKSMAALGWKVDEP